MEVSNPGKLGLGSNVHAETGDEALPTWNEEVGLSWDFWRATILVRILLKKNKFPEALRDENEIYLSLSDSR